MADLATTYLGLRLAHPVVASAARSRAPSTASAGSRMRARPPSCMPSLFEEQIRHENAATEHLIGAGTESFAEALTISRRSRTTRSGPSLISS